MTLMDEVELAKQRLGDRLWRLNNLYYIIDKKGQKVKFCMNWAQQQLYEDLHYCNIILKARQLGITTFITLLFLDVALFNSNISCGIISDTEENAKYIFRKIKFAYDSLPEELKNVLEAKIDSAKELTFSNNSLIRVGTSLRSATFQYLLISEYGKIAVDDIKRANEILTGSLNTIAIGSYCFIESTARGRSGIFYDMCIESKKNEDKQKQLTKMDYKFHFLPWWKDPNYRIRQGGIAIPEDLQEYFSMLSLKNIDLDHEQQCWYSAKLSTQAENMRREFPSTPEECWEVSNEGLYYGKHLTIALLEKRICHVPHDENLPVYTAWDLGYNDQTSIWFVQYYGKEIRLIDYVEGSGESLAHWLGVVKSKPYVYEKHLAPHDVMVHEYSSGMTRQASARKMGINLIAVQKVEIIPGIDQVRGILPRCFFDENKCEKGIHALENYKKEWNERDGCWNSSPCHNWASHGADAFRVLATGLHHIEKKDGSGYNSGHNPNEWIRDRYNVTRRM
jgi:hypothetical protein